MKTEEKKVPGNTINLRKISDYIMQKIERTKKENSEATTNTKAVLTMVNNYHTYKDRYEELKELYRIEKIENENLKDELQLIRQSWKDLKNILDDE